MTLYMYNGVKLGEPISVILIGSYILYRWFFADIKFTVREKTVPVAHAIKFYAMIHVRNHDQL